MTITTEHLSYVLRLADNALILGQRNAEWCGHGPVLEEDIALANMSLDLIGQARMLYSHAATLEHTLTGAKKTEDDYAYWRAEREFANYTLVELPHRGPLSGTANADRDYAVTIVRNYLYTALMAHVWAALEGSNDAQLAAIASKASSSPLTTRWALPAAQACSGPPSRAWSTSSPMALSTTVGPDSASPAVCVITT